LRDVVADSFSDGRRFRVLALVADISLSGARAVRELDALIARGGKPRREAAITERSSDNGTKLTSLAVLRWSQEHRVEWCGIASGKPM
jgi:hypothetical protein